MHDLFPSIHFLVDHSFGPGLYCSTGSDDEPSEVSEEQLAAIEEQMHKLVERDVPIKRGTISYADAIRQFEEAGQQDKLNLLQYRNPPNIVIYECESFGDIDHGTLVPSTGSLKHFTLIHYPPGFILHLPEREEPERIQPFKDQPHLFAIFKEHKEWGRILGVRTVGDLNATIANREIETFIQMAEALHEKKMVQIADSIAGAGGRLKLVLIAGPSSSGKTTLAKRLTTYLRVNGVHPVTLSTDNYFVGTDRNPTDEQGNPDYEHLEAVDLDLFNEHLSGLINGKEIAPPTFNFVTKKPEFLGNTLRIRDDQIILIEGIHGLNPRLTETVPSDRKFKVYISALTQLNVDSNNRVSTTDNRLMRRMVRDHQFRGHSALDTLRLWPSVRRGEKRWIFPYQSEANATFNSALDYELAVLKPRVLSLLMQVKPTELEFAEARRLSEFLLYFLATSSVPVPRNSVLREYIGGSSLRY